MPKRRAPKTITVSGEKCEVIEKMGYQPSVGGYAAYVRRPNGVDCVAFKYPGAAWRFWTTADRMQVGAGGVRPGGSSP